MNLDKLILVLLGLWALLFGLFSVTNIEIVWSRPIMGIAALALGVVCIFRAVR